VIVRALEDLLDGCEKDEMSVKIRWEGGMRGTWDVEKNSNMDGLIMEAAHKGLG